MEKIIHKINVGEWSYFCNTGDFTNMKRYGVKSSNIVELNNFILRQIEEESGNDYEDEIYMMNSKFAIQELTTYYSMLSYFMAHELKVELIMLEMGITEKKDTRIQDMIDEKLERLSDVYMIDIDSINDLELITKEIDRRMHKYKENFNKPKTDDGFTFPEIVVRVFKILGYNKVDYGMILSDFLNLYNQTLKISKDEEDPKDV